MSLCCETSSTGTYDHDRWSRLTLSKRLELAGDIDRSRLSTSQKLDLLNLSKGEKFGTIRFDILEADGTVAFPRATLQEINAWLEPQLNSLLGHQLCH